MDNRVLVLSTSSKCHSGDVNGVALTNNLLATVSSDKTVRLFSLSEQPKTQSTEMTIKLTLTELPFSPIKEHKYTIRACCLSSGAPPILGTCSLDGQLLIFNTGDGRLLGSLQHASGQGLRACKFSADSSLIATGGDDFTVCLWDVHTLNLIRCYQGGHEDSVTCVCFTADQLYLISGSLRGDLVVWDIKYGHGKYLSFYTQAHELGITCIESSCHNNGSYTVASCGNDKTVKLWTVAQDGKLVLSRILTAHQAAVMSLAFLPSNNALLVTTGGDKAVIVWNCLTGELIQRCQNHDRYVTCCCFSPDGSILATGSNDRSTILWRVNKTLPPPNPVVTSKMIDLDIPDVFLCPITRVEMADPVVAADGFTYEKTAIEAWIEKNNQTSPMTNQKLASSTLVPNHSLRSLINSKKM